MQASLALPEWILSWTAAVERTVYRKRTRTILGYALTSLEWEVARLAQLIRRRWSMENYDFLVRDTIFAEDRCRVQRQAALSLGYLRCFAINCLRWWQIPNFTVAIERFAARLFELLTRLEVL